MSPNDLVKYREVCFHALPPNQVVEALGFLDTLDKLETGASTTKCGIWLRYDIRDYTFEILECLLVGQNFHLENSLFYKLHRALIYYTEEVQLRNLAAPEKLYKSSR
ncbi:MAG: hypothetical protein K8F27_05560, partial [Sulfuricellaceae bacterium]|nr:hypothetical protein [Sulfuricellaceae bacterium]